MNQSTGQMTWRLPGMKEPLLHLRIAEHDPWKPYMDCPEYMTPDRDGMSRGFPTFVELLKQKWEHIKI